MSSMRRIIKAVGAPNPTKHSHTSSTDSESSSSNAIESKIDYGDFSSDELTVDYNAHSSDGSDVETKAESKANKEIPLFMSAKDFRATTSELSSTRPGVLTAIDKTLSALERNVNRFKDSKNIDVIYNDCSILTQQIHKAFKSDKITSDQFLGLADLLVKLDKYERDLEKNYPKPKPESDSDHSYQP